MEKAIVCFDNETCFDVEIARTDIEKTRGLMFRDKLDEDKGMIFVYNDLGDRGVWMKNTLIALDILGMDENYSVVFIKENFLPCKEDKCQTINVKNSMYVLELNSGIVDKFNLSMGKRAEIRF